MHKRHQAQSRHLTLAVSSLVPRFLPLQDGDEGRARLPGSHEDAG